MECKLTWMHSSVSSEKWTKRELHFSPTLREFWVKTRDAQTIHRAPVPLYSLTAIQEVVRSDGHVR